MLRSIHDALRDSRQHLPEALARDLTRLFVQEELLATLSTRLLVFTRQGVPAERSPPHFAQESTPPLDEAFAFFREAVVTWHDTPDSPAVPQRLAEAIEAAGVVRLLALLGQRMTPGSVIAAAALPPPRERLLTTAARSHGRGDALSVAARALTKHAPRGGFWGEPAGPSAEKNAHAAGLVGHILVAATWWNTFGHFQHERVYEARVASGHGARWGGDGGTFIGFVEPFDEAQRSIG